MSVEKDHRLNILDLDTKTLGPELGMRHFFSRRISFTATMCNMQSWAPAARFALTGMFEKRLVVG